MKLGTFSDDKRATFHSGPLEFDVKKQLTFELQSSGDFDVLCPTLPEFVFMQSSFENCRVCAIGNACVAK